MAFLFLNTERQWVLCHSVFKHSVSTSQWAHCLCIIKTKGLMLCREIIAVCYQNCIIALCESVQSSFNNAAGGTYINRCILQCYVLSGPPEKSLRCSPDDCRTSVMKYPPWMRRWMDCRCNKRVSEFSNVRDLGPPMCHCQDRNQATEKYSQLWRSIVCKWTTTFCYISMPLVAAFQAYLTLCINVVTKCAACDPCLAQPDVALSRWWTIWEKVLLLATVSIYSVSLGRVAHSVNWLQELLVL